MQTTLAAKPVSHSQTTLTELMIPAYANFGGKIHGGTLLSLMDKVAYACASRHSAAYCVTVAMDDVEFKQPVEVGDLVSLMATINYVGNSSMVIGIKVIAENVMRGVVKHTNTSFITMVAKDEADNPQQVPPLLLQTAEEVQRFVEAIRRRELNRAFRQQWQTGSDTFDLQKSLTLLSDYRCDIQIE